MSTGVTRMESKTVSEMQVFRGYVTFDGVRIDVDFEASVGASSEQLDASFLAALAQKAEINYLAIGEYSTEAANG